jgi:hypothetical protein
VSVLRPTWSAGVFVLSGSQGCRSRRTPSVPLHAKATSRPAAPESAALHGKEKLRSAVASRRGRWSFLPGHHQPVVRSQAPGVPRGHYSSDWKRHEESAPTLCTPSRNLAWALGPLLAGLLFAVSTASADTAVVGLSPKVARPGEQVDLRIACGACPADATFPISLVPIAKAPRPYPCRDNALCIRTAAAPPRQRPFLFLGRTSGARARVPAVQPPGSDSHLRFTVPKIEPGVYAFVIFAVSRRGPPGVLIADTGPGDLLRILPSETPVGSPGDGSDATWWIVAGIGTIALALAAVLLLRQRRAT